MAICGLALLAGAAAGLPAAATAADAPETLGPGRLETALVQAVNRVRVAHDRVPLRMVATLRRPARGQSRYLLAAGTLDHDGPDGSPFWTRLVDAGFPENRWMAENLAELDGCDEATARRTVAMWMASPGHRRNLLGARYRWIGAGVVSGDGCSRTVVTADFGS